MFIKDLKIIKSISSLILVFFITTFVFNDYSHALTSKNLPSLSQLRKESGYDRSFSHIGMMEEAAINQNASAFVTKIGKSYNSQKNRIESNLKSKVENLKSNVKTKTSEIKQTSDASRNRITQNYNKNLENYKSVYPEKKLALETKYNSKVEQIDRTISRLENIVRKESRDTSSAKKKAAAAVNRGGKFVGLNPELDTSRDVVDKEDLKRQIASLEDRKEKLTTAKENAISGLDKRYNETLENMDQSYLNELESINKREDSYINSTINMTNEEIQKLENNTQSSLNDLYDLSRSEVDSYLFGDKGVYKKAYEYEDRSLFRDLKADQSLQNPEMQTEGDRGGYIGDLSEYMSIEEQRRAALANQYLEKAEKLLLSGASDALSQATEFAAASGVIGKDAKILMPRDFGDSGQTKGPVELNMDEGTAAGSLADDLVETEDEAFEKSQKELFKSTDEIIDATNKRADEIENAINSSTEEAKDDITKVADDAIKRDDELSMKEMQSLLQFVFELEQYMDMVWPEQGGGEYERAAEALETAYEMFETFKPSFIGFLIGGAITISLGVGMIVAGYSFLSNPYTIALGIILIAMGTIAVIAFIWAIVASFSDYEKLNRTYQTASENQQNIETQLGKPIDYEKDTERPSEYTLFKEAEANYNAAIGTFVSMFYMQFGPFGVKRVRDRIKAIKKLLKGRNISSLSQAELIRLQELLFYFKGASKNKRLNLAMAGLKNAFGAYQQAMQNMKDSDREVTFKIKVIEDGKLVEKEFTMKIWDAYQEMIFWGYVASIAKGAMDRHETFKINDDGSIGFKSMGTSWYSPDMWAKTYNEKILKPIEEGFQKWIDAWTVDEINFGLFKLKGKWLKGITTFVPNLFKAIITFPFSSYQMFMHMQQNFSSMNFWDALKETAIQFVGIFTGIFEGLFGFKEGTFTHYFKTGKWGQERLELNEDTGKMEFTDESHGWEYWNPGAAVGSILLFALMAGKAGVKAFFKGIKNFVTGLFKGVKNIVFSVGKGLSKLWNVIKTKAKAFGSWVSNIYAVTKGTGKLGWLRGGAAVTAFILIHIIISPITLSIVLLKGLFNKSNWKVIGKQFKTLWKKAKKSTAGLKVKEIWSNIKSIHRLRKQIGFKKLAKKFLAEHFKDVGVSNLWAKTSNIKNAKLRIAARVGTAVFIYPVLVFSRITGLTKAIKQIRQQWKLVKGKGKFAKAKVIAKAPLTVMHTMQKSLLDLGMVAVFATNPLLALFLKAGSKFLNEVVLNQKYARREEARNRLRKLLGKEYNKGGVNLINNPSALQDIMFLAKQAGVRIIDPVTGKPMTGSMGFNFFMSQVLAGQISGNAFQVAGMKFRLDPGVMKAMINQYTSTASGLRVDLLEANLRTEIRQGNVTVQQLQLMQKMLRKIARERQYRRDIQKLRKLSKELASKDVKLDKKTQKKLIKRLNQLKQYRESLNSLKNQDKKSIDKNVKKQLQKDIARLNKKINKMKISIGGKEYTFKKLNKLLGIDMIVEIRFLTAGRSVNKGSLGNALKQIMQQNALKVNKVVMSRSNYTELMKSKNNISYEIVKAIQELQKTKNLNKKAVIELFKQIREGNNFVIQSLLKGDYSAIKIKNLDLTGLNIKLNLEVALSTIALVNQRTGVNSIGFYYGRIADLQSRIQNTTKKSQRDLLKQELQQAKEVLTNLKIHQTFQKSIVYQKILKKGADLKQIAKDLNITGNKKKYKALKKALKDLQSAKTQQIIENFNKGTLLELSQATKTLNTMNQSLTTIAKAMIKVMEAARKSTKSQMKKMVSTEMRWITDLMVKGKTIFKPKYKKAFTKAELKKMKDARKAKKAELKKIEAFNNKKINDLQKKLLIETNPKAIKKLNAKIKDIKTLNESLNRLITGKNIPKSFAGRKKMALKVLRSKRNYLKDVNKLNPDVKLQMQIEVIQTVRSNFKLVKSSKYQLKGPFKGYRLDMMLNKFKVMNQNIIVNNLSMGALQTVNLKALSLSVAGAIAFEVGMSYKDMSNFLRNNFDNLPLKKMHLRRKGIFKSKISREKYSEIYAQKQNRHVKQLEKNKQKLKKFITGKSTKQIFKSERNQAVEIVLKGIEVKAVDLKKKEVKETIKKDMKKVNDRIQELKKLKKEIKGKEKKLIKRQIEHLENLSQYYKEKLDGNLKGKMHQIGGPGGKDIMKDFLKVSGKAGLEFFRQLEGLKITVTTKQEIKLQDTIVQYETIKNKGEAPRIIDQTLRNPNDAINQKFGELLKRVELDRSKIEGKEKISVEKGKVKPIENAIRELKQQLSTKASSARKILAKSGDKGKVRKSMKKVLKKILGDQYKAYKELVKMNPTKLKPAQIKQLQAFDVQISKSPQYKRLVQRNVNKVQAYLADKYLGNDSVAYKKLKFKKTELSPKEIRKLNKFEVRIASQADPAKIKNHITKKGSTVVDFYNKQSTTFLDTIMANKNIKPKTYATVNKIYVLKNMQYLKAKGQVVSNVQTQNIAVNNLMSMSDLAVQEKMQTAGEKVKRLKEAFEKGNIDYTLAKEFKKLVETGKITSKADIGIVDLYVSRVINQMRAQINAQGSNFNTISEKLEKRLNKMDSFIRRKVVEASSKYFKILNFEHNLAMGRMYDYIKRLAQSNPNVEINGITKVKFGKDGKKIETKYDVKSKDLRRKDISRMNFEQIDLILNAAGVKHTDILKKLFGTSKLKTQLQADIYRAITLKMVEGQHHLGKGHMKDYALHDRGYDFTQQQLLMMVANDAGMIGALGMGGGKTRVYPTVLGSQMLLGQSPNNLAEIIVSAKQEVSNMMGNKQYLKRYYGIELINGVAAHKKGKLASTLENARANKNNVCLVFDLETRGHLSHEMRSKKELKVLGEVGTLIIDEADALSLRQQSFINAERMDAPYIIKKQAALILERYEQLKKDLKMKYRFDESTGSLTMNKVLAERLVGELIGKKVFRKGLHNPGFKPLTLAQKKGQISYLVQQTLRARAEIKAGWITAGHKTDPVSGIQFGVKDGVDINSVAAQIYEPFYRNKVKGELFTIKGFENRMGQTLRQFKAEVSKTTVEASTQEIVTRNAGVTLKVFGGSGTTWGARRISRAVTAPVAQLAEASFAQYAFKTTIAKGSQSKIASNFVNSVLNNVTKKGWGGLVIQDHGNLRQNLLETLKAKRKTLKQTNPAQAKQLKKLIQNIDRITSRVDRVSTLELSMSNLDSAFIDPVFRKSGGGYRGLGQAIRDGAVVYKNNNFVATKDGRVVQVSVMDILKSRTACKALVPTMSNNLHQAQGFKKIYVFDNYTNPNVVSGIAKNTSKNGYAVYSTAKAGRGMDFRGKMKLLILDSASIARNDMLQILGRVGRGNSRNVFSRQVVIQPNKLKSRFAKQIEILQQKKKFMEKSKAKIEGAKEMVKQDIKTIDKEISRLERFNKQIDNGNIVSKQEMIQKSSQILGEYKANGSSLYQIGEGVRSALVKIPLDQLVAKATNVNDKALIRRVIEDVVRKNKGMEAELVKLQKGGFKSASDVFFNMMKNNINMAIQVYDILAGGQWFGLKSRMARSKLLGSGQGLKSKKLKAEIQARLTDLKLTKTTLETMKKQSWQDIRFQSKQKATNGQLYTLSEINSMGSPYISGKVLDTASYIGRRLNPQSRTVGLQSSSKPVNVKINNEMLTGNRLTKAVRVRGVDSGHIVSNLQSWQKQGIQVGMIVLNKQQMTNIQQDKESYRQFKKIVRSKDWSQGLKHKGKVRVIIADDDKDIDKGNCSVFYADDQERQESKLLNKTKEFRETIKDTKRVILGARVEDEKQDKELQKLFEEQLSLDNFGIKEEVWESGDGLTIEINQTRLNKMGKKKKQKFMNKLRAKSQLREEQDKGEVTVLFTDSVDPKKENKIVKNKENLKKNFKRKKMTPEVLIQLEETKKLETEVKIKNIEKEKQKEIQKKIEQNLDRKRRILDAEKHIRDLNTFDSKIEDLQMRIANNQEKLDNEDYDSFEDQIKMESKIEETKQQLTKLQPKIDRMEEDMEYWENERTKLINKKKELENEILDLEQKMQEEISDLNEKFKEDKKALRQAKISMELKKDLEKLKKVTDTKKKQEIEKSVKQKVEVFKGFKDYDLSKVEALDKKMEKQEKEIEQKKKDNESEIKKLEKDLKDKKIDQEKLEEEKERLEEELNKEIKKSKKLLKQRNKELEEEIGIVDEEEYEKASQKILSDIGNIKIAKQNYSEVVNLAFTTNKDVEEAYKELEKVRREEIFKGDTEEGKKRLIKKQKKEETLELAHSYVFEKAKHRVKKDKKNRKKQKQVEGYQEEYEQLLAMQVQNNIHENLNTIIVSTEMTEFAEKAVREGITNYNEQQRRLVSKDLSKTMPKEIVVKNTKGTIVDVYELREGELVSRNKGVETKLQGEKKAPEFDPSGFGNLFPGMDPSMFGSMGKPKVIKEPAKNRKFKQTFVSHYTGFKDIADGITAGYDDMTYKFGRLAKWKKRTLQVVGSITLVIPAIYVLFGLAYTLDAVIGVVTLPFTFIGASSRFLWNWGRGKYTHKVIFKDHILKELREVKEANDPVIIDLGNISQDSKEKVIKDIQEELIEDKSLPRNVVFKHKGIYLNATKGDVQEYIETWRPIEQEAQQKTFAIDKDKEIIIREDMVTPNLDEKYLEDELFDSGLEGKDMILAFNYGYKNMTGTFDAEEFIDEALEYLEGEVDDSDNKEMLKEILEGVKTTIEFNLYDPFTLETLMEEIKKEIEEKLEDEDQQDQKENLLSQIDKYMKVGLLDKGSRKYFDEEIELLDGEKKELFTREITDEKIIIKIDKDNLEFLQENKEAFVQGLRQLELQFRDLGKHMEIVLPEAEEGKEEIREEIKIAVELFIFEIRHDIDRKFVLKNSKGNVLMTNQSKQPDNIAKTQEDVFKGKKVLIAPDMIVQDKELFRTWLKNMLVTDEMRELNEQGQQVIIGLDTMTRLSPEQKDDIADVLDKTFANENIQVINKEGDILIKQESKSLGIIREDETKVEKKKKKKKKVDKRLLTSSSESESESELDTIIIETVRLTKELKDEINKKDDIAKVKQVIISEDFAKSPGDVMSLIRILTKKGYKMENGIQVEGKDGSRTNLWNEPLFKKGAIVKNMRTDKDLDDLLDKFEEKLDKDEKLDKEDKEDKEDKKEEEEKDIKAHSKYTIVLNMQFKGKITRKQYRRINKLIKKGVFGDLTITQRGKILATNNDNVEELLDNYSVLSGKKGMKFKKLRPTKNEVNEIDPKINLEEITFEGVAKDLEPIVFTPNFSLPILAGNVVMCMQGAQKSYDSYVTRLGNVKEGTKEIDLENMVEGFSRVMYNLGTEVGILKRVKEGGLPKTLKNKSLRYLDTAA
jgi:hypothetical protein